MPPVALRHVAALLMLPVFVLLLAAYLPGRIKAATKHPMLVATKLWATAHLLANGNLADVLLFGGFLAWAVADRISMKHRVQRPPGAPAGRLNDLIAVLAGLALYALFITVGHHWLIGVTPFWSRALALSQAPIARYIRSSETALSAGEPAENPADTMKSEVCRAKDRTHHSASSCSTTAPRSSRRQT